MIKSIDVRFFTIASFTDESGDCELGLFEITDPCFIELSKKQGSSIEYDRITVYQNGVRGVHLTVTCIEYPDISDLDIID